MDIITNTAQMSQREGSMSSEWQINTIKDLCVELGFHVEISTTELNLWNTERNITQNNMSHDGGLYFLLGYKSAMIVTRSSSKVARFTITEILTDDAFIVYGPTAQSIKILELKSRSERALRNLEDYKNSEFIWEVEGSVGALIYVLYIDGVRYGSLYLSKEGEM